MTILRLVEFKSYYIFIIFIIIFSFVEKSNSKWKSTISVITFSVQRLSIIALAVYVLFTLNAVSLVFNLYTGTWHNEYNQLKPLGIGVIFLFAQKHLAIVACLSPKYGLQFIIHDRIIVYVLKWSLNFHYNYHWRTTYFNFQDNSSYSLGFDRFIHDMYW